MWNNIGGKIKVLAKVIFWIGAGISVICAIVMFVGAGNLSSELNSYERYYYSSSSHEEVTALVLGGFAVLIIGPLLSWINSFLLVGFGQLVQNTDRIVYDIENTRK